MCPSKSKRGSCVIESLETRRHLSAQVVQTGSTLAITGDYTNHTVKAYESDSGTIHQTVLYVDGNGNGTFTDPGDINGAVYKNVTKLVIQMAGGNNTIQVALADPFVGATHKYNIQTGTGADNISFTNPVGNDITSSSVILNINAGDGSNTVSLGLNRVASSTVQASITTGSGADTVNIYGGSKVSNSAVNIVASLGAGNDVLNQTLDWDNGFGLLGSSTVWRVTAYGGPGHDSLGATGLMGNSTSRVEGTLDIEYFGGGGGSNFSFALDRFSLSSGGTLKLRATGGGANDTLSLSGNIGAINGGGMIDIALSGGAGNDTLTSSASADPLNHYATPQGAVLDGGLGFDTGSVSGTLLATLLNTEA